eukprot:GEZU01019930.1.p1 GENE.GEZU01019930.1~~GEZU01019930.1.p1  ORF type:complete len:407 (+),score=81.48 GEZU01019930.1:82-1221(+)
MSLNCMPFLIVNLGGEMLYILEQRLQAQNIPAEKSTKVLQDVTRAMFHEKFVNELFKPQALYSSASTREIFDRLAHSSIMRLSESSMDKLYDLITMGFKHQLLCSTYPEELLQITLNHLDSIRYTDEVAYTRKLIIEKSASLSRHEFGLIKQNLCDFFQDKKVKVSLFLQNQIQNSDGTIVIPRGGPIPPTFHHPGFVRYFKDGQEVRTDHIDHPAAAAAAPEQHGDPLDPNTRPSQLGKNLYKKTTQTKAPEAQQKPAASTPPPASPTNAVAQQPVTKVEDKAPKANPAELNFLARLIRTDVKAEKDNFKINLFPESFEDSDAKTSSSGPSNIIVIDNINTKEAIQESNRDLVSIMDNLKIDGEDFLLPFIFDHRQAK